MSNLTAGRHDGKIKYWSFRKSKEKKTLTFSVAFDVGGETVYWNAYPASENEKAQEIFVEALRTMGFQGGSMKDLVEDQNALDKEVTYSVVVEFDDNEGKSYPRVKWVNLPGAGNDEDAMEQMKSLKGLNALFMAKPSRKRETTYDPQNPGPNDIPF